MPKEYIREIKMLDAYLHKIPFAYREGCLILTYYISFPGVFTPDMLYQLYSNFKYYQSEGQTKFIHSMAVSDVLHAPFCSETGFELFEIDEGLQSYLQGTPKKRLGVFQSLATQEEIAAFVCKYVHRFFNHPHKQNLKEVLYWKAITLLAPDYAGSKITEQLLSYSKSTIPSSDEIRLLLQLADLEDKLIESETIDLVYDKFPMLSNVKDAESTYIRKIDHPLLREKFKSSIERHITKKEKIEQDIRDSKNVKNKLLVLCVGIDAYEEFPVWASVNNVESIENFIKEGIDINKYELDIISLCDVEATRDNVINTFLNHFQKAKNGDTCLFYFSGHGSSTQIFESVIVDGMYKKNETLVLFDSRDLGGRDLCDIELNYMIHKVSKNKELHFLVVTECSFSISITKYLNESKGRHTKSILSDPNINKYSWKEMLGAEDFMIFDNQIKVPSSSYIAISACRDDEEANEKFINDSYRGVFTYCLIEVLQKSRGDITYQDLIKQVSIKVSDQTYNQHPTISSHGIPRFKKKLFLDGIFVEQKITNKKPIRLASIIPKETNDGLLKVAITASSEIEGRKIVSEFFSKYSNDSLNLIESEIDAQYLINATNNQYYLINKLKEEPVIHGYDLYGYNEKSIRMLSEMLRVIARWHKIKSLESNWPGGMTEEVELNFYRVLKASNNYLEVIKEEKVIDIFDLPIPLFYALNEKGKWEMPSFRLKVKASPSNKQVIWISIIFLGQDYSITNELCSMKMLNPDEECWLEYFDVDPSFYSDIIPIQIDLQHLKNGIHEITERFKIVLATTEFDIDSFNQEGILESIERRGIRKEILREKQPLPTYFKTIDFSLNIIHPGADSELEINDDLPKR